MPVITSPKGLRFWLELCGVEHNRSICKEAFKAFGNPNPGAERPLAESRTLDATAASSSPENSVGTTSIDDNNVGRSLRSFGLGDPRDTTGAVTAQTDDDATEEVLPYGQAWFETTMSCLRGLDGAGVAGVHVMAPGPGPRRMAKSFVDAGVFGARRE